MTTRKFLSLDGFHGTLVLLSCLIRSPLPPKLTLECLGSCLARWREGEEVPATSVRPSVRPSNRPTNSRLLEVFEKEKMGWWTDGRTVGLTDADDDDDDADAKLGGRKEVRWFVVENK